MTKKNKLISLILLLVLALLAAVVAGTSVSRYVFDHEDSLQGSFTNLYFSHNGEGTTAIMQEEKASNGITSYVGYISFTANNFDGSDISARHIQYKVRALSASDIENDNNYVLDGWGVQHPLDDYDAKINSYNYSVVPVKSDMTDYVYDTDGSNKSENFDNGQGYLVNDKNEVTLSFGSDAEEENGIAKPVQDSRTDILKITRTYSETDQLEAESFYIVIEIIQPYQEIKIFRINTSTSLIAVGSTSVTSPDTHFGYDEIAVNIQTARKYGFTTEDKVDVDTSEPAKIILTWKSSTAATIFDSGRLAINSEENIDKLNQAEFDPAESWTNGWYASTDGNTTTVTLYLPQSSEITLYFYVPEDFTCTVESYFHYESNNESKSYQYTQIAGVDSGGTLVSTS